MAEPRASPPFLNRHHRSNGDCLEGRRENYQVCSVQYCVQQLCTYEQTNRSLDWVLSHWAHFTVLRFIVVFCVSLYIACMCRIVTWWGGPGGLEAWFLGLLLPSVLWHCWLGHLTRKKPIADMTYNVFSGTLNPTQSVNQTEPRGNPPGPLHALCMPAKTPLASDRIDVPAACTTSSATRPFHFVHTAGVLYSAPSRMVSVSASVNLPLYPKVQKFSSDTGSPRWSQKEGRRTVVCVCVRWCCNVNAKC